MKLVRKGGTQTFKGLIETAGIASPFGEEALKQIANAANKFLADFDKSKLK